MTENLATSDILTAENLAVCGLFSIFSLDTRTDVCLRLSGLFFGRGSLKFCCLSSVQGELLKYSYDF
jgi:hypothetical protein